MASEYVTFIEQPVVGRPVVFIKNGQRLTSSPVVSVSPDPSQPGIMIVHTASGSTYTGQYQPNYQQTMYSTQYSQPPQMPGAQAGWSCLNCGSVNMAGSYSCSRCGAPFASMPRPGAAVNPGNERTYATLCHISLIPIHFIGPLIFLLVFGNDSKFVGYHARQALNFAITMAIASVIVSILCIFCIGYLLLIPMMAYMVIAPIIAAIRTNEGEYYVYPLAIRFLG